VNPERLVLVRCFRMACAILLASSTLVGCGARRDAGRSEGPGGASVFSRQDPFVKRAFHPFDGERWIGNGVAYGPHRDGQYPGGPAPSEAELRQDLELIAEHWSLLRLYGAVGPTETILEIIREDQLDLKVMLGIWIAAEERRDETGELLESFPEAKAANRREIEAAARLTAAYPDIVLWVSVGNETQVFWSAHRIPPDLLIRFVREVRARTLVPVPVADDFNFWNKPDSRAVAREIDFIVTHMHPLWNGILLDDAVGWTRGVLADVQAVHPEHTVVLGETGWATQKHDVGEQATLIRGQPGEEQQKIYYEAISAWIERERIVSFFFEAFDENWKGGEHPNEVEKHWGLFRADRTPKKAMSDGT
jgi:exo-beta-1,3-glucanase (GH17 family)